MVSTEVDVEAILSNGVHRVTHSVKDMYSNVASYTTLFRINNDQLVWVMDYSYCSSNMEENNYGNVYIEVIKDGEKFSSVYNSTNLGNSLEVTNIVYMIDADTQSIDFVKFNIKFDAELKNENNSKTLNLKDMKGVFHIEIN